jgi:Domain of unknown function (DUF4333)
VRFRLPVVLVSVLALSACSEVPEVNVNVPDVNVDLPDAQTLESLSEGALEGANGVAKYLQDHYQLTDIGAVDCPATPSLSWEKGATFECAVTIGGEQRTVEVSVLNETGGIQVSEPR